MHLKNFSLLTRPDGEIVMAPAYDLVCTKIVIPDDKEESALTINGRKSKLARRDFDALALHLKIPDRAKENIYARFSERLKQMQQWINVSFLPDDIKGEYLYIMNTNKEKIGL